ncbi:hypothetical protein GF312_21765 [Candidatus Poribacteria bacterium]|nr:hypothetical protein [Candidatus Poribacteria bacterium]
MSHPALDIENWELIKFEKKFEFPVRKQVLYNALKIDARKFYFFLKEKFGEPNINYQQVKKLFLERRMIGFGDWCYVFVTHDNLVIVTGDDLINIAVLSINEPPVEIDFEIFGQQLNNYLENFDLNKYDNIQYDIYVNYGFFLNELIQEYITKVNQKIPLAPNELEFRLDEMDSNDPMIKYKHLEYARDYNGWLRATLERATISLQIQILMPIHFESLVDLAFRIKLKGKYYNENKNYGDERRKKNIFEFYEGLNLHGKLEEIQKKCFSVNKNKMTALIRKAKNYNFRRMRNKLLHGNSLFLKNLNLHYYFDSKYVIGFPDRHRAERVISESISQTLINEKVDNVIKYYTRLNQQFLEVFDDKGKFKNLASGIVFGHNRRGGGSIGVGISNSNDLLLPTE